MMKNIDNVKFEDPEYWLVLGGKMHEQSVAWLERAHELNGVKHTQTALMYAQVYATLALNASTNEASRREV